MTEQSRNDQDEPQFRPVAGNGVEQTTHLATLGDGVNRIELTPETKAWLEELARKFYKKNSAQISNDVETGLRIAGEIIAEAYRKGSLLLAQLGKEPSEGEPTREAVHEAVKSGLVDRATTIKYLRGVWNQSTRAGEGVGNFTFSFNNNFRTSEAYDLGIEDFTPLYRAAKDEEAQMSRLVAFPALTEYANVVEQRAKVLEKTAQSLLTYLDSKFNTGAESKHSWYLQSRGKQAMIIRGSLVAVLNGAHGRESNPLLISDEDLSLLAQTFVDEQKLISDIAKKDTQSLNQSNTYLLPTALSAITNASVAVSHIESDEKIRSTVVDLCTDLFLQVATKVVRWRRYVIQQELTPSDPKYWTTRKANFEPVLPIQSEFSVDVDGLSPEDIPRMEAAGMAHLWTDGINVSGKMVPSLENIATYKQLLSARASAEARFMLQRLEQAENVIVKFLEKNTELEERISQLASTVAQGEEELASFKKLRDENYTTSMRLLTPPREKQNARLEYLRLKKKCFSLQENVSLIKQKKATTEDSLYREKRVLLKLMGNLGLVLYKEDLQQSPSRGRIDSKDDNAQTKFEREI